MFVFVLFALVAVVAHLILGSPVNVFVVLAAATLSVVANYLLDA